MHIGAHTTVASIPMIPQLPPASNMADVTGVCDVLNHLATRVFREGPSLATKLVCGDAPGPTKTRLEYYENSSGTTSTQLVVARVDRSVFIEIEACGARERTPSGQELGKNIRLSIHHHTESDLDRVVHTAPNGQRHLARSWTTWRAARKDTVVGFVGQQTTTTRCVFVLCIDASHVGPESKRIKQAKFMENLSPPDRFGKGGVWGDWTPSHLVFVCPANGDDACVDHTDGHVVWKV